MLRLVTRTFLLSVSLTLFYVALFPTYARGDVPSDEVPSDEVIILQFKLRKIDEFLDRMGMIVDGREEKKTNCVLFDRCEALDALQRDAIELLKTYEKKGSE